MVQCGQKCQIYNYSLIAKHALGDKGKLTVDIFVSACLFSFTVAHIAFIMDTLAICFGEETSIWVYAAVIMCVYSPLAWVRELQYFSFGYILGCLMIVFTAIVVSTYCVKGIMEDGPMNDGFRAVNPKNFWYMIGFSFYSFEGIGVVMPVMEQTKNPENFSKILTAALITLAVIFTFFATLCYYYFGDNVENIVIYSFEHDWFINLTELAFCVNLICTYPLAIYAVNQSIEDFIFEKTEKESFREKWLRNLSRTFVCFMGCFCAIIFKEQLDNFLGLSGAVLGITVILILPTMCHYRMIAESKRDKIIDLVIMVVSFLILVLCTYNGLVAWISGVKQH